MLLLIMIRVIGNIISRIGALKNTGIPCEKICSRLCDKLHKTWVHDSRQTMWLWTRLYWIVTLANMWDTAVLGRYCNSMGKAAEFVSNNNLSVDTVRPIWTPSSSGFYCIGNHGLNEWCFYLTHWRDLGGGGELPLGYLILRV